MACNFVAGFPYLHHLGECQTEIDLVGCLSPCGPTGILPMTIQKEETAHETTQWQFNQA